MAYSINLTDAQKTEVSKLIAESTSPSDTVTGWLNSHLAATLEPYMRARLDTDIDKNWPDRAEKKEAIKALDPADMETEYVKYFPSE
jgi:hypothetical protein